MAEGSQQSLTDVSDNRANKVKWDTSSAYYIYYASRDWKLESRTVDDLQISGSQKSAQTIALQNPLNVSEGNVLGISMNGSIPIAAAVDKVQEVGKLLINFKFRETMLFSIMAICEKVDHI